MNLEADRDVCASHEMCIALLPDVFELDDNTNTVNPKLRAVPEHLLADVQLAVDSCPTQALRLEP